MFLLAHSVTFHRGDPVRRTIRLNAFVICGMLFGVNSALGQDCPALVPTIVFYGNGINTPTTTAAYESLNALADALGTDGRIDSSCMEGDLRFHRSHGFVRDLIESWG